MYKRDDGDSLEWQDPARKGLVLCRCVTDFAQSCWDDAAVHLHSAPETVPNAYCASHKNWIHNIRFSIMNRPLSQ